MLQVAALAVSAVQFFGGRDAVDPATHASPSGAWELHVDPSSSDGSGGARYRMRRGGEVTWSAGLDVTLLDAGVTDGSEVWVLDEQALVLHRYALP